MKRFVRGVTTVALDPRVITGVCGVVLSVVMHELFHIIIHWAEIDSIHIFPDAKAIVEVIFVPTAKYDLVIEEAVAYLISSLTLLLTAMLIADVDDMRNKGSVQQTIATKTVNNSDFDEEKALEHLATILGISGAPQ